ncbi:MAG: site-specific DNA-methyltransferase [Gammaproteobacteria bacterium AqS3]|nr:site-specific DNA-methyltransferase [Gammaproteobacteria bacterium AqS3]
MKPRLAAASITSDNFRLYQANCLEVMDHYIGHFGDAGCFDMIFADPPYFLSNGGITCHAGKMVRVDKGDWDRSQGPEVNHEFNTAWLSRCRQLLRPNGTLWVSGTHHVIHSVGFAMQQLGMKILNTVIWQKPNPPPNLSCRYFTHSFETVLWAAKSDKSKHTFDYDKMREENGGKQMKDVWEGVWDQGDWDQVVWNMTSRDKKLGGVEGNSLKRHPTQKPLLLLDRIIRSSTNKNDLILDPFAGSGTTGVAALLLDRRFVGCELEKEYFQLAERRLKNYKKDHPQPRLL